MIRKYKFTEFVLSVCLYAGFALYLYRPYFGGFDKWQQLLPVNACLAAVGCFVLSRRWISSFAGSFFAGIVYGFGPFMLGLAKFHPTAGFLAASIPWLFYPAVFGFKRNWRWLRVPLSALPFAAIVLFFQVSLHYRLFAVSAHAGPQFGDLSGIIAPLVMAKRDVTTLVGFYHIPLAALLIGLSMLVAARRLGVMMVLCLGLILAFGRPVFSVSPVMWLSIVVLGFSVVTGVGIQGLLLAGNSDRKWILASAIIMGVLAIVNLLLATKYFQVALGLADNYARLFVKTAGMYILGAFALGIVFFMTRANLRLHLLRWLIICSAIAVDIFLGARFIVDKLF